MKNRSTKNVFVATLVLLVGFVFTSPAQQRRSIRHPTNDTRPRLILLIVVDQFRYDYLTRFGDMFTTGGIGRLMRDG
ncbi:MAG TPA: hypothetical protein VEL78_07480, partial [Pyrinomonadaceae bacterium]|nr:hypothetical protein [Pyrinomonadaceae bacterium]